jgi:hypothetical protein
MSISIWEIIIYIVTGLIVWFLYKAFKHSKSQSKFISDDKVFITARKFDSGIREIFGAVSTSSFLDIKQARIQKALALYLIGICDYIAQANNLDDSQFGDFYKNFALVFENYFDESTADKALIFLATLKNQDDPEFEFIKLGGQTCAQLFANKNKMALVFVAQLFMDLLEEQAIRN